MFNEKVFIEELANMGSIERKIKFNEINVLIYHKTKLLNRLVKLAEEVSKIDIDIKYHSRELKILNKLKMCASREASIIYDM